MQVNIIPVGDIDTTILGETASVLREQYNAVTEVNDVVRYSELDIDPLATPYDAEQILSIESKYTNSGLSVVLTRLPITHADRAFVFGISDDERLACIVSTYRLFQNIDNSGFTDPGTALSRVRKEVVHEVGHALGQPHCGDSQCAMSFSMDLSDIDTKSEYLCENCASTLTTKTQ